MKVLSTQSRSSGTAVRVQEDGGPIIEAWTPADLATVQGWNGVVPDGYELKKSRAGNQVLVEKQARGGGGWRQSKEAFELEQKIWAEKNALDEQRRRERQAIDQEGLDVRTALMQAVASVADDVTIPPFALLTRADEYLEWIRKSKTSASPTSPDRVDAGAAAVPGREPAAPEPAGDGRTVSPGSPTYPMKPEECDHKTANDRWLPTRQIRGVPYCPRCGESAIIYRESG